MYQSPSFFSYGVGKWKSEAIPKEKISTLQFMISLHNTSRLWFCAALVSAETSGIIIIHFMNEK